MAAEKYLKYIDTIIFDKRWKFDFRQYLSNLKLKNNFVVIKV